MHFGDRFSAGELHFDYKLTPGSPTARTRSTDAFNRAEV
jgi:hypothetical protein